MTHPVGHTNGFLTMLRALEALYSLFLLFSGATYLQGTEAIDSHLPGHGIIDVTLLSGTGYEAPVAFSAHTSGLNYVPKAADFNMESFSDVGQTYQCQDRQSEEITLSLSCEEGCQSVVSSSDMIRFTVQCVSCQSRDAIEYTWTLKLIGDNDEDMIVFEKIDDTGWIFSDYNITADSLKRGQRYAVEVTGRKRQMSTTSSVNWTFTVNAPPKNGHCEVNPSSDDVKEARFVITCYDWQDDDTVPGSSIGTDSNGNSKGLRYEILSRDPDSMENDRLVYSGTCSQTPPLSLPFVEIVVRVVDGFGDSTEQILHAQVHSTDESVDVDTMISVLNDRNPDLIVSRIEKAAGMISVKGLTDKRRSKRDLHNVQRLRSEMVNGLQNIPSTVSELNLKDLKSLAKALKVVTSVETPNEMASEVQIQTSTVAAHFVSSLAAIVNRTTDICTNDARTIIEDLFTSCTNILNVALQQSQGSGKGKEIISLLLSTLDHLLDIALSTTPTGDVYHLWTETTEAKVGKIHAADVTGMTLTSSFGEFDIPSEYNKRTSRGMVFVKFMAFAKNPYTWNTPKELSDSPVASLVLTDQNGRKVSFKGMYTIRIGNVNWQTGVDSNSVVKLSLKPNSTADFNLNPLTSDAMMVVSVDSQSPEAECDLYVKAGGMPHARDHDTFRKISGPFPRTVTHHTGENTTQYFTIQSGAQKTTSFTHDVQVSVKFLVCRYWNEDHEDWRSDGCRPALSEDNRSFTCHCDHLTAFTAAEFVVPVNKIDFDEVFNKNILDNSVVLIVILSFFGLYLLLMIWLRRKDKADLNKWMVVPLVDNKESHDYVYKLSVYTGIRPFSGTNCDVYFDIVGENESSGVRLLKDIEGQQTLSRGTVRNFSLTVPRSLGTLVYVHIWIKPKRGTFDPWYLERLLIVDVQTKESFNFVCYDWLAVDKSDEKVERILPISGDAQLSSFDHLISNNTRVKFTDEYLWGSLISRPTHSYFTRIERLSCCITYLYMAMLSNAMFYKTSPDVQDNTMKFVVGPLVFTAGTVYTGLISCLVTLPATLIVVEIFRKARPFPGRCCGRKKEDEAGKKYRELEKKRKKSHPLPWWCKIIGWFLVFASMFLSSFFVVLYSLQWGKEISHQWLTSEMMSFFMSACIIDPLKSIGLVLLVTVIFVMIKKPFVPENDKSDDMAQPVKTGINPFINPGKGEPQLKPPTEEQVRKAHDRQMKRNHLKVFFRQCFFYIVFLFVASEIASTYRSGMFFYSNKAIMDVLDEDTITDCRDTSCFWQWLSDSVIPAVNPKFHYNGQRLKDTRPRLSTYVSYLVGPVTLRQVRVRSGCTTPEPMDTITHVCIPPYTDEVEQVGAYNDSWSVELADFNESTPHSPWIHTKLYAADEKYAPRFFSKSGVSYAGFGYVALLNSSETEARKTIRELFRSSWVDRNTRAVFVEFAIYNANINLYSLVTLLTEFFTSGTLTATCRVDSVLFLDLFNFNFDTFIMIVCHVVYLVMVVYLTCWWALSLCREGRKAVRGVWKSWDMLLWILSVCSVGLFFARLAVDNWAKKEIREGTASYGTIRFIIIMDDVFTHFIALVSFFCIIGFLRLLTLYKRTRFFFVIFRIAYHTFVSFSIILGIIFLAFVQLFYLFFGKSAPAFHSFYDTLGTLMSVLLGSFRSNSGSVFAESPRTAQAFMVMYIFIESWVLIMLLVSVLNIACTKARLDYPQTQKEDAFDVLGDWYKDTRLYEYFQKSAAKKKHQTKGTKSDVPEPEDPIRDLNIRLSVIEQMINKMISKHVY